jgi:predicted DNA-binding transcriptional regulator AlpA
MASNAQGNAVAATPFVGIAELKQVVGVKHDQTIKSMIAKKQIPEPRRLGSKLLWSRRELAAALGVEL